MFIEFLKKYAYQCPSKKWWGIDCMGCGFQRSLIALLEGNILDSFKLYPALIPLLVLWLVAIFHLCLKIKHGAVIIKFLFILCAIIIVINFFYKLFQK